MSCIKCYEPTKYVCIRCKTPVCNRSVTCSVPVSDSFEGWKETVCVALCPECDAIEFSREEDNLDVTVEVVEKAPEVIDLVDDDLFTPLTVPVLLDGNNSDSHSITNEINEGDSDNNTWFEIKCASRGFHETRRFWRPQLHQVLDVQMEAGNVFDPYAMALKMRIPGQIEQISVVGHIPREISRFCHFFVLRGGELRGKVRDTNFRRSPLPQGGLEIPITLLVFKRGTTNEQYQMMRNFIINHYADPENIEAATTESEEGTDDEAMDQLQD